jgi:hypothetical protein
MGIGRKIVPATLFAALLQSASATTAASAREPLIITSAGEPRLIVTESQTDSEQASFDDKIESLSRAVGQVLQAEQQATESACRSAAAPKAGTAEVYAWRARCSYQRH